MNLLEETIADLTSAGKTPADVRWVGTPDFAFSWDVFAQNADREYDKGYGLAEVASDLKIVGDDWWLERYEYDGSEWWEYKTLPNLNIPISTDSRQINLISGPYGGSLAELQKLLKP